MKKFSLSMAVFSCLLSIATQAAGITVDENAPDFSVTSGSGEVLTAAMLKDKIAIVFYETKQTKDKNRVLKERLNDLYNSMPANTRQQVLRIAIIRCSAFMPLIWKRSLREHSAKEGITIYGDWDGAMEKDYAMQPDDSNFIIVGRSGIIRYMASGIIPDKDFDAIEKIIIKDIQ